MAKYKIILAQRVDQMLLRHTEFLTRVSIPAAQRFYREFETILRKMEDNPFQFPAEEDSNLPSGRYRKALFEKWYKAVFSVSYDTIYLDAVVDCRMDNRRTYSSN